MQSAIFTDCIFIVFLLWVICHNANFCYDIFALTRLFYYELILQICFTFSFHGKRLSNCSSVIFSSGLDSNENSRYLYGLIPLALAVSNNENTIMLASAPSVVSQNSQFFRPTVTGLIEFSLYSYMKIKCWTIYSWILYWQEKLGDDWFNSWCWFQCIIYSIAETAKANNLKPYDYFEYLLTEIPKHLDESDRSFCENLLPWSDKLPAKCRK